MQLLKVDVAGLREGMRAADCPRERSNNLSPEQVIHAWGILSGLYIVRYPCLSKLGAMVVVSITTVIGGIPTNSTVMAIGDSNYGRTYKTCTRP